MKLVGFMSEMEQPLKGAFYPVESVLVIVRSYSGKIFFKLVAAALGKKADRD